MAVKVQHLRSSTASKRPTTAALLDGELSLNTNSGTPGIFIKDSTGASIIKFGPAEVGSSAPNATPASGGSAGNSTGEFWLDTANTGGNSQRALKIFDGSAWQYAGSVTLGSTNVQLGAAATTTIAGMTSLTSTSLVANTNIDLANQADLKFFEATANGTNYVGFQAPAAIAADVLWTLPAADATVAGQVLSSNAAGVLSWASYSSNSIAQGDSAVTVTDTGTDGTVTFKTDNVNRWVVNNLGHLVPSAGSTYNLGAVGTTVSNAYIDAVTATTVNKVTITAPATSATLTIANGKTLTVNNSLTLAGTDSTTMTFPASSTTVAGLSITQTFTGVNTFTPAARTSGSASYFTVTTPADTTLTASTESIGANFTAATRQFATGALTLQRERVFDAPTYGFVAASTLTTAINVDIAAPVQGTNATITNAWALRAAATLFTGTVQLSGLTASQAVFTDANKNLVSNAISGTGSVAMTTNASLTTPSLSGETFSTTNNVTAGTNAQGQGALTSDYSVITTAAANPSGVTLPTATTGRRVIVVNKGANPINVYPASGATIDALAANASVQLAVGQLAIFNASSTTQWYSTFNLVNSGSGVSSFSAGTTGLTPSTATTGAITLAGTLAVANGGTGQTSYTDGQLLIGNTTGNTLTKATLTNSTGISITNGAGSITIAVSGVVPTSIATGSGTATPATNSFTIAGGTGITTSGATSTVTVTLANTAVTAASYGSASQVATFTVDQQGRLTAAANTSISITASQVSNFDTQVRTSRLDQMAAPTASVSMNSQKITNLADPTLAQDAATKAYVDSTAQGLDVKSSCRLATAAALPAVTYANGTAGVGATLTASAVGALSVDGIAVALNDRVLVKDQASSLQNGIYTVTTLGTVSVAFVLTRATDMDQAAEFPAGFAFIEEGNTNADSGWVCTTDAPVTVGTTNITFAQFSGAGQITAGAGLTKTGNTLDVNVDSRASGTKTIAIVSDEVRIDSAWTGQNTITTLGTVTTGTWNATAIGLAYGGTGQSNTSVARYYAFMGPNNAAGNASFREILTSDIAPITGGSFDAGTY